MGGRAWGSLTLGALYFGVSGTWGSLRLGGPCSGVSGSRGAVLGGRAGLGGPCSGSLRRGGLGGGRLVILCRTLHWRSGPTAGPPHPWGRDGTPGLGPVVGDCNPPSVCWVPGNAMGGATCGPPPIKALSRQRGSAIFLCRRLPGGVEKWGPGLGGVSPSLRGAKPSLEVLSLAFGVDTSSGQLSLIWGLNPGLGGLSAVSGLDPSLGELSLAWAC